MKKIVFILIINFFNACSPSPKTSSLSDAQWLKILENVLIFTQVKSEKVDLYPVYLNQEFADTINFAYHLGSDIYQYEVNDSVVDYIYMRKNNKIDIKLDSLYSVEYLSDSDFNKRSFIIITEPFDICNDKLCFTITRREPHNNKDKYWIVYLIKNNNNIEILSIYDLQQDALFETKSI